MLDSAPDRVAGVTKRQKDGDPMDAGTENRGLIIFLQLLMVIMVVGLIVAFAVIDV